MAFPTTSILSQFTGSEDPLSESGNFAGPIFPSMAQMKKVSNQAMQSTLVGSQSGSSYWTVAAFGPGVEVYVTIPTWWNNASSDFWLWANGNAENTAGADGYLLYVPNGGTWNLSRVDNTVATQLGADLGTQVPASGDSIGLEIISGGTHQAYYKSGAGAWSTLGTTRSDNTYTSGHIGFSKGFVDTTSVLDNFGGGASVVGGQPMWKRGGGVPGMFGMEQSPWRVRRW